MAKPRVIKKTVHAVRRAPGGSAFQKCEGCGASVAIALLDMHEYECGGKISERSRKVGKKKKLLAAVHDQPRSAFCFFMESYMRKCKAKEWIEIGRAAFEIWVNMTPKEKLPFVNQAGQINSAHLKALLEEVKAISGEEDEADSAVVGKFDPFQDYEELSDCDGYLHWRHHRSFESLDSFDLLDSSSS